MAIVIFDSRQRPGSGQALYLSAHAEQVPEPDIEAAVAIFSAKTTAQGLPAWSRDDVLPPAARRLYRAIAREHFLLSSTDERIPVTLA